jgi:FkbM family methyltransferase
VHIINSFLKFKFDSNNSIPRQEGNYLIVKDQYVAKNILDNISDKFLNLVEKLSDDHSKLYKELTCLRRINNSHIYIFGAGTIGKELFQSSIENEIQIQGFIDSKITGTVLGSKVYNLDEIEKDSIIVVSVGKECQSIIEKLKILGFKRTINPSQFNFIFNIKNTPELKFHKHFKDNKLEFLWLYSILSDKQSKSLLGDLLSFRNTLDTTYLKKNFVPNSIQWFDKDIYNVNSIQYFVDGGAHNGDTIQIFLKFSKNPIKIVGYELNKKVAETASKNFYKNKNVNILNYGLSNYKKNVIYDENKSTGCKIIESSTKGSVNGIVNSLDDSYIDQNLDLLKLDIEGEEMNALIGSSSIIKRNQPVLAIAVYHKPQDILEIPKYILKLSNNYNFYLRHYTELQFETVLYAIPKK